MKENEDKAHIASENMTPSILATMSATILGSKKNI